MLIIYYLARKKRAKIYNLELINMNVVKPQIIFYVNFIYIYIQNLLNLCILQR